MPQLRAQAAALLSARLGREAAAPRRSELGPSWDRAAARVSTLHPHPPGPSRGLVSLRQGSNVPQHLSRRAQSPSTLPLLMLGKLQAVLRKCPLKKTKLSRSQSRHAKISDLCREPAETNRAPSANPLRYLCSRNRGLADKDRMPPCCVVHGREAKQRA